MVLQLVGCGRVGHCQPFPLVVGVLVLFGVGTPTTFFVLPAWARRRRRQRTNHLGIFAHTAPHLPNTLMAWTKAQASAESYLKL